MIQTEEAWEMASGRVWWARLLLPGGSRRPSPRGDCVGRRQTGVLSFFPKGLMSLFLRDERVEAKTI
jgi:hypothetical protein